MMRETHLSQLFFTADRVFKLLKPVALPFVDFTDRATRCAAATTEYEQNRAISPDVYLGLADIIEDGVLMDRLIVMRRLRSDQALTEQLNQPELFERLHQVARRIASLHASLDPCGGPASTPASAPAIEKNWNDNFSAIAPYAATIIGTDEFAEVRALAASYIAGRSELFDQRIRKGWIRSGHGDLRAEHIYCTDDGPRIIDCVAFDDRLRISDCLADVAFLGMDLDRLAGPEAAVSLMTSWNEFTNEQHPSSLAHFYVAYRAHVRCKIACLRFEAGHEPSADEARGYHHLALRHLRLAKVHLVLVGGGVGTGKSTIAGQVADRLGAAWLRTDEIRKDIAGIGHDCHDFAEPGEGIYSAEMTERTYEELVRQTRLLLRNGVSVVVDATWASAERRGELRALAVETSSSVAELQTQLAPAIAKERIARRMASVHNPSDATPELVDYVADRFEPWPEAVAIDTGGSVAKAVAAALAVFDETEVVGKPGATVEAASSSERIRFDIEALRDALLVAAGLEPQP